MASNDQVTSKRQDITVVESDVDEDDVNSESSEEFNFAVALALRKNLTETFDKHIHSSNVSDKIARFESRSAVASNSGKLPPRPQASQQQALAPRKSTPLGVYLRVRPLSTTSQNTNASTAAVSTLEILSTPKPNDVPTTIRTYPPTDSNAAKVVRSSGDGAAAPGGVKEFEFSQVFGPESSQQNVYSTVAAPLVSGLFGESGESALLFAYGITNAGKTHTIMGNHKDPQTWGIIPRALQDIFSHMESKSSNYRLNLSYMEIYNEGIYDLLPTSKHQTSIHQQRAPLRLRESSDGQIFVRGLAKHTVKDVAHALQLAESAQAKRHTSSNNINSGSSRSHCICQLELVLQDKTVHPAVTNETDDSTTANGYTTDEEAFQSSKNKSTTLWIVDLAGSERSKRTGIMQGSVRQKEAALINSSLMKLMRCLSVMRRNQSLSSTSNVVPFRESKLTHLFMNHLTGPSANRTLMVVNVNPAVSDFDETQHVLAYATAARAVQITQDEYQRKRKDMGDSCNGMEPTHDYNGHALKRFKSSNTSKDVSAQPSRIAKLVRQFSPKTLMAKQSKADPRNRTAEVTASSSASSSQDGELKAKAARLATIRAMGGKPEEEAAVPPASYEKELKNLKTSLVIAQAEAELLRSEKQELEEQLSQRETQVRMEIAEEMEVQMRMTREQYNGIIENLKLQVQSNPTPAIKSTKKAQQDKAEQYIEELIDKVDECEEEMVRMRQEHEAEVASLNETQVKTLEQKEQEIKLLKSTHVQEIVKLEAIIAELQGQLERSSNDYAKLETSKKEMMENYERLFREDDDDNDDEDSDDEPEDDDNEEEDEKAQDDPTPVRRGRDREATSETRRLARSTRRASKVAVASVKLDNIFPSAKKLGRRLRSGKRMPFSPLNHENNPSADTDDTASDNSGRSSFGPDKWLRPRKPVERDESTGAFLRPRGRAPTGRDWDEKVGAWRLPEVVE